MQAWPVAGRFDHPPVAAISLESIDLFLLELFLFRWSPTEKLCRKPPPPLAAARERRSKRRGRTRGSGRRNRRRRAS